MRKLIIITAILLCCKDPELSKDFSIENTWYGWQFGSWFYMFSEGTLYTYNFEWSNTSSVGNKTAFVLLSYQIISDNGAVKHLELSKHADCWWDRGAGTYKITASHNKSVNFESLTGGHMLDGVLIPAEEQFIPLHISVGCSNAVPPF